MQTRRVSSRLGALLTAVIVLFAPMPASALTDEALAADEIKKDDWPAWYRKSGKGPHELTPAVRRSIADAYADSDVGKSQIEKYRRVFRISKDEARALLKSDVDYYSSDPFQQAIATADVRWRRAETVAKYTEVTCTVITAIGGLPAAGIATHLPFSATRVTSLAQRLKLMGPAFINQVAFWYDVGGKDLEMRGKTENNPRLLAQGRSSQAVAAGMRTALSIANFASKLNPSDIKGVVGEDSFEYVRDLAIDVLTESGISGNLPLLVPDERPAARLPLLPATDKDIFTGTYAGEYRNTRMKPGKWKQGSFMVGKDADGSYYSSDARGGHKDYVGVRSGHTINLEGTYGRHFYTVQMQSDGERITSRTYTAYDKKGGQRVYSGAWRNLTRR